MNRYRQEFVWLAALFFLLVGCEDLGTPKGVQTSKQALSSKQMPTKRRGAKAKPAYIDAYKAKMAKKRARQQQWSQYKNWIKNQHKLNRARRQKIRDDVQQRAQLLKQRLHQPSR